MKDLQYVLRVHRKRRVQWAKEHVSRNLQFWKSIIFSDESKFVVTLNNGEKVWRQKSWRIQSWMHTKDGEVSSFSYGMEMIFTYGYGVHEICWENLEVRWLCHKSKSTKKWLTERNIEILPLPANSPDLNHNENAWNDIKKAIRNKKSVTRVWNNFSDNTIDKLIT